jgi:hypothetical protein
LTQYDVLSHETGSQRIFIQLHVPPFTSATFYVITLVGVCRPGSNFGVFLYRLSIVRCTVPLFANFSGALQRGLK